LPSSLVLTNRRSTNDESIGNPASIKKMPYNLNCRDFSRYIKDVMIAVKGKYNKNIDILSGKIRKMQKF